MADSSWINNPARLLDNWWDLDPNHGFDPLTRLILLLGLVVSFLLRRAEPFAIAAGTVVLTGFLVADPSAPGYSNSRLVGYSRHNHQTQTMNQPPPVFRNQQAPYWNQVSYGPAFYSHNPTYNNPMPFGDHQTAIRSTANPFIPSHVDCQRLDYYRLYNDDDPWGEDGYGAYPLPDPTLMARHPFFPNQLESGFSNPNNWYVKRAT